MPSPRPSTVAVTGTSSPSASCIVTETLPPEGNNPGKANSRGAVPCCWKNSPSKVYSQVDSGQTIRVKDSIRWAASSMRLRRARGRDCLPGNSGIPVRHPHRQARDRFPVPQLCLKSRSFCSCQSHEAQGLVLREPFLQPGTLAWQSGCPARGVPPRSTSMQSSPGAAGRWAGKYLSKSGC